MLQLIYTSKTTSSNARIAAYLIKTQNISVVDYCTFDGIDYSGNDIVSYPNLDEPSCAKKCSNEPKCNMYAYSKSRKICWLKFWAGEVTVDGDIISGRKKVRIEGMSQGFLIFLAI